MKDKYSKESTQLRDFQKEGVKFLLKRPRSILGDAVGLGKTLQFLTAFAIYKSKFEGAKLIIVTNKSLIKQTEMQVGRFFEGFRVKSLEDMTPKKRWEAYGDFFGGDFDILIWGYGSLRNDLNPDQKVVVKVKSVNSEPLEVKSRYGVFKVNSKQELSYTLPGGKIKRPSFNATYTLDVGGERFTVYLEKKPYYTTLEMSSPLRKSEIAYSSVFMKEMENFRPKEKGLVLVLDEALSVKSPKSAAHKSVRMLCESCSKVVAVTATISKGGLEEPYNILKCLGIKVVENWEVFSKRFLIYNLSHIKVNGKRLNILVGYKNRTEFQNLLAPYYIGRSKSEVAQELPPFILKDYFVKECAGVKKALTLLYNAVELEDSINVSLARVRIANICPQLMDESIPGDYISGKVQSLIDAINNNFYTEKLIIYCEYKTPVDLLEQLLPSKLIDPYKIPLKITGDVKDRGGVLEKFENSGDHNLLLLTSAGKEGLNLQMSADVLFLSKPFKAGDFIQVCGRVSRIGTKHSSLCIHSFLMEDSSDTDLEVSLQIGLRIIQGISPNSVDQGLMRDCQGSDETDSDYVLLEGFKSRVRRYIS